MEYSQEEGLDLAGVGYDCEAWHAAEPTGVLQVEGTRGDCDLLTGYYRSVGAGWNAGRASCTLEEVYVGFALQEAEGAGGAGLQGRALGAAEAQLTVHSHWEQGLDGLGFGVGGKDDYGDPRLLGHGYGAGDQRVSYSGHYLGHRVGCGGSHQ